MGCDLQRNAVGQGWDSLSSHRHVSAIISHFAKLWETGESKEINVNRSFMRRPAVLGSLLAGLIVLLWLGLRLRGPELPGYLIEAQPLVQTVVATGRVISTSRTQVGSEVTGTVLERRVQEGDLVKPGDVLIVLRADDLTARVREAQAALRQLQQASRPQAEAALRQADALAAQAVRERQRRADLFARQLVAREVLEQAEAAEAVAKATADRARLAVQSLAQGRSEEQQLRERLAAARAQLNKTSIRAQIGGVVLTRNVEPGDLVQPGKILFEIARSGVTEIEVPVDEKNLAVLAVGQSAQCVADAYPDQAFAAAINYVAPGVDAQRGTVTVRLRVDPVPAYLRQDMTVSVSVQTGRRSQALAVPNDALLYSPGRPTAVLAVRSGRLARVPVQLGLKGLAMTEVTAGLEAGAVVLVAAGSVAELKEGSRLRVRYESLPGAGAQTASRRELPVRFN
jgi:HlyD family secretion protein